MKKVFLSLILSVFLLNGNFVVFAENFFEPQNPTDKTQLTVFYMNDTHGELTKFGKIYSAKKMFDEKNSKTNTISSASGDMYIGKKQKIKSDGYKNAKPNKS